jgi:hypothetical protein
MDALAPSQPLCVAEGEWKWVVWEVLWGGRFERLLIKDGKFLPRFEPIKMQL